MLTVPDNRSEDNPAAGDEHTTTLAGRGRQRRPGRGTGRTADTGHAGSRGGAADADDGGGRGRSTSIGDTRDADGRGWWSGDRTWRVRAPLNDKRSIRRRPRAVHQPHSPPMRRLRVSEVLPRCICEVCRRALPGVAAGLRGRGRPVRRPSRGSRRPGTRSEAFQRGDLSDCDYVYVWVTGFTSTSGLRRTVWPRGAGGRHQGAGGARLSGEPGKLGERAAGPAGAWTAGAGGGDWGRGAGLLVGVAGRVAGDDGAAGLVPQAGQRARQAAEASSAACESSCMRLDAERGIDALRVRRSTRRRRRAWQRTRARFTCGRRT